MKSVVVDWETYYGDDYTLSSMTTEQYVRDPRFEPILCGFKIGKEPGFWVDQSDIKHALKEAKVSDSAVIAHHAHFDGLIMYHHYGLRPKMWLDTLSMARAVDGAKAGNSLAKLCERHGLIAKGVEVENYRGWHHADFDKYHLDRYGKYCVNDCEREYELLRIYAPHFCRSELNLIDSIVRMYTEPVLELNEEALVDYRDKLKANKTKLLMMAGVQLSELRSAEKFADVLRFHGIVPPTKLNNKGKEIYAFAKTDQAMKDLAEHPDDDVQAIIAARLNARSTINESRVERLLSMASRGRACVYIAYYAALSGRGGGGDKLNWQNNERVAFNKEKVQTKGFIRNAVEAPDGYECVVGDSSNIESRMLDWLAGQDDQVEAYRLYDRGLGPDIYCVMAEKIYGRVISKVDDPDERFVGKTAKLGLGYGTGAEKFAITTKMSLANAAKVVNIYRTSHNQVVKLWNRCKDVLPLIAAGDEGTAVDFRGVVVTCKGGLLLPNGMVLKYQDLKQTWDKEKERYEWTYWDGKARQRIYGAKVVENIVQALARIVVMEQTLMVKRRLVLSVHDEGVWVTKIANVPKVIEEVKVAFRTPLSWCEDLPLNCEVGSHKSYGKAKK
jgi:hypothetical protein